MPNINTLVETLKARNATEIENTIRYAKENLERQLKNTDELFQAAALLAPIGIAVELSTSSVRWGTTITLNDARDISRVVQAIGPVKFDGSQLKDAKTSTITKSFRSKHYPCLRFEIDFKLPSPRTKAGRKTKCKIVKRRVTEAVLVCEA